MALDPTIPLKVLTPDEVTARTLANSRGQQELSQAQQLQPGVVQEQGQTIDTNKLAILKQKNDLALQALGTVVDQPSYERAKAWAQQQGLDTSRFPDQYDPNVIMQARLSAGSAAQQLNAMMKQQEMTLQATKAGIDPSTLGLTGMPRVNATQGPASQSPVQPSALPQNAQNPGMTLDGAQLNNNPAAIAKAVGAETYGPPAPQQYGPPQASQVSGSPTAQASPVVSQAPAPISAAPVQQVSGGPPVKSAGESNSTYNSRLNAWKTQKLLELQTNKLVETVRHNQATEGQGLPGSDETLDTSKTGDEFLKTLPANVQAAVKGVADGTLAMPQPNMRSPIALKQWENFMGMVKQYDPTADVNRKANSLKFDTGPQGNQVRSLNVAVSHLDTLNGLVDALDNGDVQAINKASQAVATQLGSPAPTDFNAAKQIVGDEIIKAVVGAGGTGGDRDKAAQVLAAANSPAQLKGVIQTYKTLMAGQLQGLGKQYEDTTGKKNFADRLTPAAKAEIGNSSSNAPQNTSAADAIAAEMARRGLK